MIWQLLHLGVNKLIEDLKDLDPVKETVTPELLKDAAEKLKESNKQEVPFVNKVASGELNVAIIPTKKKRKKKKNVIKKTVNKIEDPEKKEREKERRRQYAKEYYQKHQERIKENMHQRYISLTYEQRRELNRKRHLRTRMKKEAELKRQQELEWLTQHPTFRYVRFSD